MGVMRGEITTHFNSECFEDASPKSFVYLQKRGKPPEKGAKKAPRGASADP